MSGEIKQFKSDRRGGARQGAGRRKGSKGKISPVKARVEGVNNAIIARVAGDKLDPVESIMETVEWAVKKWRESLDRDIDQAKEWAALANEWASKAAPYIRPRLAAVEARVNINVSIFDRIERARGRLAIAA